MKHELSIAFVLLATAASAHGAHNLRTEATWDALAGPWSQRHLFYARKKDGQPLLAVSQHHALTALWQYFKWCARQRLIPANPASELELPKPSAAAPLPHRARSGEGAA